MAGGLLVADIGELRKKIDDVDDNILELLNRRAELVKEVGRLKTQGRGTSTSQPVKKRYTNG